MLKVSLIKISPENWKCGSSPQNSDFDDLPFGYYPKLITILPIDHINENIVEMLNNS